MARLATPLWLVEGDGRVVWSNGAAREHLGLAGDGGGEDGPGRARLDIPGSAAPSAERCVDGTLSFQLGGHERAVRCRFSPAEGMNGFDGGCLLAEAAPADSGRSAAEAEATHQLTTLVHHLSHELRTPLNAVVGFSERSSPTI